MADYKKTPKSGNVKVLLANWHKNDNENNNTQLGAKTTCYLSQWALNNT